MVSGPIGTFEGPGSGSPPVPVSPYLEMGSFARCSITKRSLAPLFHDPCWVPQSCVMSLVVCPATVGGLLTSSKGWRTSAPPEGAYETGVPPNDVPTIDWVKARGPLAGPPA